MMQSSGEMRRESAESCLSIVIASQRVRPFGRPDDRLLEDSMGSG
jgi:hypothetical protein